MSSIKDKITSILPGHKNTDANANGIPDRLERGGAAGGMTGFSGQNPLLGQQGLQSGMLGQQSGLLGQQGYQSGFSSDLNRNGIPDQFERQGLSGGLQSGLLGQQGYQSGFSSDLNRNGIPDQLEGGFSSTSYTTTSSVIDVREAPAIIQKVEKAPVIHEVIRTEEVVEVQPVIQREREQLDVYEVVQPIREREIIATEVRTAVLPAQTRAAVVQDQSAFLAQRSAPAEFSTRDVAPTLHQTVQNAPIIHETIHHKVIEEVQPVIYKEIDRPVLIKETLPIYEKIVEAPHAHHTVLPVRDLGTRTVSSSTSYGMTDFNRNGIPDQLERGFQQTGFQQTGFQQSGFQQTSGLLSQPQVIQGGLQSGLSSDLNRNGIPDQFERQGLSGGLQSGLLGQQGYQSGFGGQGLQSGFSSDLNGNGIPDRMEKGQGLNDLNGNGINDSLERRMGTTTLNSQTY